MGRLQNPAWSDAGTAFKRETEQGRLAGSVLEHVTRDLLVVSPSPTLGVELT